MKIIEACILLSIVFLCGCSDLVRQGSIKSALSNFEDGDYRDAINSASQAENYPDAPHEKKAEIIFIKALIYEKMGRNTEAQGLFKFLREKFGDTQYGFMANEKIDHPPSAPKPKVDGHLIANADGTVSDTTTGLMWAAYDSALDLNLMDAKGFCENYHGGGYADWRLPTLDELAELYSKGIRRKDEIPGQIVNIHWRVWASDEAKYRDVVNGYGVFSFNSGTRHWIHPSTTLNLRALLVRGGN